MSDLVAMKNKMASMGLDHVEVIAQPGSVVHEIYQQIHDRVKREHLEENDRLRLALREIIEEWAGAECGEPVYAQEAYAIALAKRMYQIAADALAPR